VKTVAFERGGTRSNSAILKISNGGVLKAAPSVAGGGTVHVVLDVNGWFE
jgi:hypothetical protein